VKLSTTSIDIKEIASPYRRRIGDPSLNQTRVLGVPCATTRLVLEFKIPVVIGKWNEEVKSSTVKGTPTAVSKVERPEYSVLRSNRDSKRCRTQKQECIPNTSLPRKLGSDRHRTNTFDRESNEKIYRPFPVSACRAALIGQDRRATGPFARCRTRELQIMPRRE
jgi:hypothetical protein